MTLYGEEALGGKIGCKGSPSGNSELFLVFFIVYCLTLEFQTMSAVVSPGICLCGSVCPGEKLVERSVLIFSFRRNTGLLITFSLFFSRALPVLVDSDEVKYFCWPPWGYYFHKVEMHFRWKLLFKTIAEWASWKVMHWLVGKF